ncbi:hypothetical protein ACFOWM_07195 [Ferruginibacter yonginensis]|uniref:Uncharacterized protein n=1 Tax=Ferruginibacter yonginensis TaxID=1310416 RepID=A0ABV8QQW5_9BACT
MMNTNFYEQLSKQSTNELLHLYTTQRNDYSEAFLMTIEKILDEREVAFLKIADSGTSSDEKLQPNKIPFNKKLFIKIVIIVLIIGALGLYGKIADLEGKINNDDYVIQFANKLYTLLSFPFAFIAEKLQLGGFIFIAYLINLLLLATCITYLIGKSKNK